MTPKQRLRQHIEDMHKPKHATIIRMTMKELQRYHHQQHHHYAYAVGHIHEGENLGANRRPSGWCTGDDVRSNDTWDRKLSPRKETNK